MPNKRRPMISRPKDVRTLPVVRDYVLDRGVVLDRRSGLTVSAAKVLDGDLLPFRLPSR